MMSKIIKNNKYLFILLIIVFVIIFSVIIFSKKDREDNGLEVGEVQAIIDSGNFLAENIRGIDEDDYVVGNNRADVDIIVYEDISNYFSADLNKTIEIIKSNYPKEVKIAFRPYIDKSFPFSVSSGLFVLCAGEQDKFFEARKLLLSEVEKSSLSEESFSAYMEKLELNKDSMNNCLKDEEKLGELESIKVEAESFEVFGSPTIFVGSEKIGGARPFEDFKDNRDKEIDGMESIINRHLEY
jgi:hypothetical protein